MCMYIRVCISLYVCWCVCVCVCVYMSMCVYVFMCVNIFSRASIHVHKEDLHQFHFRRYGASRWFLFLVRFCCALSVVSVCMNTPVTFMDVPDLQYVTLVLDIFSAIVFLLEIIVKIRLTSMNVFLRTPTHLFEVIMFLLLFVSIILQLVEMFWSQNLDICVVESTNYLLVSLVRIPRPLLLIRAYHMSQSRVRLPRHIKEYIKINIQKVCSSSLVMTLSS